MRLRFTPRAAAELDAVLDYIAARSPQGGRRIQMRIQSVIVLLLEHPHAGMRTSKAGLRRIVVTPYPYLIFYRASARNANLVHHAKTSHTAFTFGWWLRTTTRFALR